MTNNTAKQDILVLTVTLGKRESLSRTIDTVQKIGGERIRHIIIAPQQNLEKIKSTFADTECVAEPDNKHGIYAILNHYFNLYGKGYRYLSFVNDDDFWLDNFKKIIDATERSDAPDIVYGKTQYVNKYGIKIGTQTCSSKFHDFIPLLRSGIILLTQQAALIKSDLFFKLGGFDESYYLVADTKLWAKASLQDITYKYIPVEAAAYTINKGHQLSSDHELQAKEHTRLLNELQHKSNPFASVRFRITNIPTYAKRILHIKGHIKSPVTGRFCKFFTALLPWKIKRYVLNKYFLYDIAPSAHIGLSFIYPHFLRMKDGATIGHLNVAINLDSIEMGRNCIISRSNWITGFPTNTDSLHFAHDKERQSRLIMGDESSITKNHHIDCTNVVRLDEFAAIGGYNTQILTHSVDMYECRQDSKPITIGKYSLVATRSIITGGAELPAYSVLCAGAYLGKKYDKEWTMYGGVPARPIKEIPKTAKRFSRTSGYIY